MFCGCRAGGRSADREGRCSVALAWTGRRLAVVEFDAQGRRLDEGRVRGHEEPVRLEARGAQCWELCEARYLAPAVLPCCFVLSWLYSRAGAFSLLVVLVPRLGGDIPGGRPGQASLPQIRPFMVAGCASWCWKVSLSRGVGRRTTDCRGNLGSCWRRGGEAGGQAGMRRDIGFRRAILAHRQATGTGAGQEAARVVMRARGLAAWSAVRSK